MLVHYYTSLQRWYMQPALKDMQYLFFYPSHVYYDLTQVFCA